MSYSDVFTTGDNGKVLALPLPTKAGAQNDFTGASAVALLKDPVTGTLTSHTLIFNPTPIDPTTGVKGRWEYAFAPGDLPTGHTGLWRGMAAVTFPGAGPIYSSEFQFSVIDPD
jgi:hypothetical protein